LINPNYLQVIELWESKKRGASARSCDLRECCGLQRGLAPVLYEGAKPLRATPLLFVCEELSPPRAPPLWLQDTYWFESNVPKGTFWNFFMLVRLASKIVFLTLIAPSLCLSVSNIQTNIWLQTLTMFRKH